MTLTTRGGMTLTLLKTIVGETGASSGVVTLGSNVKIGYFSQHALDLLHPESTVFEDVSAKLHTATIAENVERNRDGEQFAVLESASYPTSPTSPIATTTRARIPARW